MTTTAPPTDEPQPVTFENNEGQAFWNCDITGGVHLNIGRFRSAEILYTEEHIRHERSTYVSIDGHERLLTALRTHHGAILVGGAQSGRKTADVRVVAWSQKQRGAQAGDR